jgi:hypothetical protein
MKKAKQPPWVCPACGRENEGPVACPCGDIEARIIWMDDKLANLMSSPTPRIDSTVGKKTSTN